MLSLSQKIYRTLALLIASCAVVTAFGIYKIDKLADAGNHIVNGTVKKTLWSKDMQANVAEMSDHEKEFVLGRPKEVTQKEIEENFNAIKSILTSYDAVASEEAKKNIKQLRASLSEWEAMHSTLLTLPSKDRQAFLTKVSEPLDKFKDILKEVVKRNEDKTIKAQAELEVENVTSRYFMLIIGFISILVSSLVAFSIMRTLIRSINGIVSELSNSSEQLTQAANQLSCGSESLASANNQQSASLTQIAASMTEMSQMVQKNSDNAELSVTVSKEGQTAVIKGQEAVNSMVSSVNDIQASNEELQTQIEIGNKKLAAVTEVIAGISEKAKVINDIVFQTKLLSFNASIEAARAGEYGRGFSVVAEEVGKLAQISGQAAKEINDTLASSIKQVEEVLNETKTNVEALVSQNKGKVANGVQTSLNCGAALEELYSGVNSMASISGEVANASKEQSIGVSETTRALEQLEQVTNQNSATAQSTASAASELTAQSETLSQSIELLKTVIYGNVK